MIWRTSLTAIFVLIAMCSTSDAQLLRRLIKPNRVAQYPGIFDANSYRYTKPAAIVSYVPSGRKVASLKPQTPPAPDFQNRAVRIPANVPVTNPIRQAALETDEPAPRQYSVFQKANPISPHDSISVPESKKAAPVNEVELPPVVLPSITPRVNR